jgi:mannose-1-phosphate guanylyltransferase
MAMQDHFYAVILAGGTGTRLWPLSRQACPKQALQLIGERTMMQHAVDRLAPLFAPDHILVVTRGEYAPLLGEQVPEVPAENFILEPEGRGTAAAIGLASIHLKQRDPDAVMAILTADHYIGDVPAFQQAVQTGYAAAQADWLVTLGIHPDFPSTGFGYIHQGAQVMAVDGQVVYRVESFVEKPDGETAQKMLAAGGFSWNSGMFLWKAGTILAQFEQLMPELYQELERLAGHLGQPDYLDVLQAIWPTVKKETIDYGIMERAKAAAIIPVEIRWTDVGSWGSLEGLLPTDRDGNIWTGVHLAIGTHNTLALGGKRLIATIGVDDLIIVDTPDAVLVMKKEREQDVKAIVNQLADQGLAQFL